jgi:hypothetical protein
MSRILPRKICCQGKKFHRRKSIYSQKSGIYLSPIFASSRLGVCLRPQPNKVSGYDLARHLAFLSGAIRFSTPKTKRGADSAPAIMPSRAFRSSANLRMRINRRAGGFYRPIAYILGPAKALRFLARCLLSPRHIKGESLIESETANSSSIMGCMYAA